MQTAINIVIAFTALVVIAALVFAVYYKKKEKERAEGKRPVKSTGDSLAGYKTSGLKDSREFIKDIEDIRDGIIITDNATRFIAALNCRGVGDFYDRSASDQIPVMRGYVGFYNTVNKPITYRMNTKELDMDYTLNRYSQKREAFIQMYKNLEASLAGIPLDKTAERRLVQTEMEQIQFRIAHLTSEMQGIEHYSSSAVAMEQVQTYVFDWKYRASDFDTDLSPAERFVRAKAELEVIAASKIAALSSAEVKARVCTQGEMIDICRRVSQPISVERFGMKELDNSSFFEDIVTSESIKNMDLLVGQEFGRNVEAEIRDALTGGNSAADNGNEVFTFGEEE